MVISDVRDLSMCEVKRRHAQRIRREKHRRDSSSLILEVDGSLSPRELVLYYPRENNVRAPAGDAWWYPHDPFLPGLERVLNDRGLVARVGWNLACPDEYSACTSTSVRQLGYHPGQRATLLLSSERWPSSLVVKLVRPAAFAHAVRVATQIETTRSQQQINAPTLVGWSTTHAALVYNYLPGTALHQMSADRRHLFWGAAEASLRAIHSCPLPDLPLWDPEAELAQTRALIRPLRDCAPAAADTLEHGLDALRLGLTWSPAHPRFLVHNDLSARNLIWSIERQQLAVVDWDRAVLGPVERDLASLLSALGSSERRPLLSDQAQAVDLALIDWVRAHQKLLKSARRALSEAHAA